MGVVIKKSAIGFSNRHSCQNGCQWVFEGAQLLKQRWLEDTGGLLNGWQLLKGHCLDF